MTLPSNDGGTEFNRANNNTRYKVRLSNRLVLKEQDWEVALVSLSFPIRDHHKHHILSNFLRGTVVTKVIGTVTHVKTTNELDERTVSADVRIKDITDPDTSTDVTPVKSGMTFMRHWEFACKKAIQKAVLKTIQDDSTYKGARWGNESNTQKGLQSFIFTSQDSLIIDGTDTIPDNGIHIGILARLGEIMGIIAPKTAKRTKKGKTSVITSVGETSTRTLGRLDFVKSKPFTALGGTKITWNSTVT